MHVRRYKRKKGADGGPLERKKGLSKGGALLYMGPEVYDKNMLNTVFGGFTYENIGELCDVLSTRVIDEFRLSNSRKTR